MEMEDIPMSQDSSFDEYFDAFQTISDEAELEEELMGSDGGDILLIERVMEVDDDGDLDTIGDVKLKLPTKALKPRNYQLGLCLSPLLLFSTLINVLFILSLYSEILC